MSVLSVARVDMLRLKYITEVNRWHHSKSGPLNTVYRPMAMGGNMVIAVLLLISLLTEDSEAKLLSGAARWNDKGTAHQHSYAMGMLKQSMTQQTADKGVSTGSNGVLVCSGGKKLRSKRIAKAMSAYYDANPARSAQSPSMVFNKVLEGICLK